MDATSTVEVVGAEGGAGNSGGGGGAGGDMVASVTSIMENSKDAMAELFQDEAEVDEIIQTEFYLFIFRRQEDRMVEQILHIQDMPSRSEKSHAETDCFNHATLLTLFLQANAGYEIPARLRTLHNLVIQYASQGRCAEGS